MDETPSVPTTSPPPAAGLPADVSGEPVRRGRYELTVETLKDRYHAYRRQQARDLLSLVPREALRPLYREASALQGPESAPVVDPLAFLTSFVARRLPLPPFGVWCDDLWSHPEAHLDEAWMVGAQPDRRAPLALERRDVSRDGETWSLELEVFREGEQWRGRLVFTAAGDDRRHRTSDVFRESDLADLRRRFHEFDDDTLEAFLRSVLP